MSSFQAVIHTLLLLWEKNQPIKAICTLPFRQQWYFHLKIMVFFIFVLIIDNIIYYREIPSLYPPSGLYIHRSYECTIDAANCLHLLIRETVCLRCRQGSFLLQLKYRHQ